MKRLSIKLGKPLKIIYDIGANLGDDLEYYLKKADKVIAVEANPELTAIIEKKYHAEILAGRLFIENCVVTVGAFVEPVPFFVHQSKGHGCSTFVEPSKQDLLSYKKIFLPSKTLEAIIQKHGLPYYIKIDVEGYDADLLRALFSLKIFPQYISVESHSIEVFSLLVGLGNYSAFKLVDGDTLGKVYKNCQISTMSGQEKYSFKRGSAGPFGNDVLGQWMSPDNFFRLLAFEGLGWKDIHATNLCDGDAALKPNVWSYVWPYLIKKITPKPFRKILSRVGLKSSL